MAGSGLGGMSKQISNGMSPMQNGVFQNPNVQPVSADPASGGGKGGTGGQPAAPASAPQQGQYAPLSAQGDFNVNQAAAGALQQSMQGAQAGMGFQPGQIRPTGYQANTAQAAGYRPSAMTSQGYNAATAGATGFDAAKVGSQGYTATGPTATGYNASSVGSAPAISANNVQAGQLAGSNLGAYTNQYESQVVDQALGDIERSRQMAGNQLGAQATAANAFGGSRQGIAEAETNRAYAEQAAKTASGLRQAGFTQAQQMAQADIGTAQQAALANQQASLAAGTTTAQLGQQANLSNQAAANQASQFGAAAQNVASQQAAAARNAAAQFGAGAANQATSQGANLQQAASQFGAGAANTAALQNAASLNAAGQFGASAANQAAATNMAAQNAAAQFGAGATNQMGLSNMGALNAASQYNASNAMSAQQQNVANQMAAQGMRMGAGAQLGQLGQQAFNTGQTIQQNQSQQGLMQQGLQQALIDAARGQYAGYTAAPNASLAAPLAALGATPDQSTTTQTNQRGLFDYLGLAAGMAGVSDTRLKTDIKPIGSHKGINLYTWIWNDEGKRIADPAQPTIGVMAQELRKTHPHLVEAGKDGYLRVNYVGLNSELEAA